MLKVVGQDAQVELFIKLQTKACLPIPLLFQDQMVWAKVFLRILWLNIFFAKKKTSPVENV